MLQITDAERHRIRFEIARDAKARSARLAPPPAYKRILKGQKRENIIERTMDVLRDWRSSIFQHEGACRAGLRAGLVLAGHKWIHADLEAEAIVLTALNRLGAKRPKWEQGQPEYVDYDGCCINCGKPVNPEPGDIRGLFFCDEVCQDAKRLKRETAFRFWQTEKAKQAAYAALKATFPKQTCERCQKEYSPTALGQRWCSHTCFHAAREDRLPDRNCQQCGKLFHPTTRSKAGIYCSPSCASAGRTVIPLKDCERCGTAFKAYKRTKRFCSLVCSSAASRDSMTERECQQCGDTFMPAGPKTVYCSPKCRNRAAYEKSKQSAFRCDPA